MIWYFIKYFVDIYVNIFFGLPIPKAEADGKKDYNYSDHNSCQETLKLLLQSYTRDRGSCSM